jgi:hypothetical protein
MQPEKGKGSMKESMGVEGMRCESRESRRAEDELNEANMC